MPREESLDGEHRLSFLDALRHELKTPLSSILAYADLSLGSNVGSSRQDAMAWNGVRTSAQNLSASLDNVLDLIYLDSGEVSLVSETVDLVDVVVVVDKAMRPRAEAKHIEFVSYVSKGVPLVEADPDKLRRALENIVDNAIKFTSEGGSVVLDAFYRKNNDEILIGIDDNGIGIAPGDRERIFDRFVQVDASDSRNYEGCGLGLTVARAYIAQHGGRIEVDGGIGEGSSFTVVLPARTRQRA